eukprot:GHUV01018767.1.p1 GENE.GHUV01018767.1~~GHUV01018767.1.p1  ORF type:complete len:421 (+),score=106.85 GHUV01018767.1:583-1845(+)
MKQQHSTFADIDAPAFNVDERPDFSSLFIATIIVAAAVYLVTAVIPWPSRQRRRVLGAQHKGASRAETRAATTVSADCFTQSSTTSPPFRTRPTASRAYIGNNNRVQQSWYPRDSQSQQQPAELDQLRPNKPFRFRAPDLAAADSDEDLFASPQPQQKRRQGQFLTPQAASKLPWQPDADDDHFGDEPVSNWDSGLLDRCAASSPYITSLEALQSSPAYRSHISAVRGRRLQYETAETHKLKIYKALRDVDPPGFQQLFSRKDIKEFDEVTPSQLLSAFECLSSSSLTLVLLLLPWLIPGLQPYGVAAALLWCCLYLLAASKGCISPVAWVLSIHSTYGEYGMFPSCWRMLAALALETGLVVLTAGTGVLVTLLCRMLTEQRQGFAERVLQLVPLREVVRPMHFNQLPPAGSGAGGLNEY